MVINSIEQTDFQKQYIDQSEQDKKDTIDFYKSYLPELTTPQESLDLQSKRIELDAIQQEQQERATFFDKAATTKDIYLKNTIVGSITEKLGITNYKVNASDYDKEDGFEPDKNVVVDFALQNRANDDRLIQCLVLNQLLIYKLSWKTLKHQNRQNKTYQKFLVMENKYSQVCFLLLTLI